MTRRKLAIPVLLLLALSIFGPSLIPSAFGADSPAVYIDPASIVDVGATQVTVDVRTDYTGSDIWGYEFTLTYDPLVLNGSSVTNGDLITNPPHPATFSAGTFDNDIGELGLTAAFFNVQVGEPVNETSGPGLLATVVFDVVGTGDTPITLGVETKLKRGDGTDIVNAWLMPTHIGHGYFSNVVPAPTHDVAVTDIVNDTDTYCNNLGSDVMETISSDNENQGTVTERYGVSTYYKVAGWPELLGLQTIDVASGNIVVVAAVLNTTEVGTGYVTLEVVASAVFNETDTTDNTYTVLLLIKLVGDVQGDTAGTRGDGDVDRYDFGAFAQAYGTSLGQLKWNIQCDFDRDNDVDRYDFGYFAQMYGQSTVYILL
jgi:hypothetical protein